MVKPSTIMTCYVVNKITGTKIVFDVYPEEVSESYSSSWETTDIRGRSAPYYGYSGSEARTVSFSVTLHDDICPNLDTVVKNLEGLVYPNYKGSIVIPPFCQLKVGSIVSMKAIVQSVNVSWSGPVLDGQKRYAMAEVSLEFTELRTGKIPTAKSFT